MQDLAYSNGSCEYKVITSGKPVYIYMYIYIYIYVTDMVRQVCQYAGSYSSCSDQRNEQKHVLL